MSSETLIIATLLIPTIGAALIALTGSVPNLRESVTLATAISLFFTVMVLLARVLDGQVPETGAFEIFQGVEFAFPSTSVYVEKLPSPAGPAAR